MLYLPWWLLGAGGYWGLLPAPLQVGTMLPAGVCAQSREQQLPLPALSMFVPPTVSCIAQAHEEWVYAHLFLVEMYFIGPFALKYSLNFSSCGMPSTFNISVAIVYFLLHPEYNRILSLSYK